MSTSQYFYDETALVERLSTGIKRRNQEVIFLVGAPMSAPSAESGKGVPDVAGIIDLIREEFKADTSELAAFDQALENAGDRRYQAAFVFLQGRRGPQTVNDVVRQAVLAARTASLAPIAVSSQSFIDEELCRSIDLDIDGWSLNPGTEYLGKLIANYPNRFGRLVLTTNFDPLIEVSVLKSGGHFFRTNLHLDGYLGQTEGTGCHVVHLHGYWHGSDTLHTPRQLGQPRPRLKASLNSLIRNRVIVVAAYGGWDDAFTEALMDVVRDDTASPEVIWTFFAENPVVNSRLSELLEPGISRGRVSLYKGIDCNTFFPRLLQRWKEIETPSPLPTSAVTNPVLVSDELRLEIANLNEQRTVVEGDEEDRPPVVEFCVGRDQEIKNIRSSKARVVFVTGFGGQGKSTLAAQYFSDSQRDGEYTVYVWRDCKEESERFENQLASVIERLTGGKVHAQEIVKQPAASIVESLMNSIEHASVLFVFDNVDHYVNLETNRMIGALNKFIEAFLQSSTESRVVFTCRPSIRYESDSVLHCPLTGLKLDAAIELFEERGARCENREIKNAHDVTEGHAFWLDLLAIQVTKRAPAVELTDLVNEIQGGGGPLPEATLNSIWATLRDREQLVLRSMAETVKPETEMQISEYLSNELNFNKVSKAIRTLRALNLIVVKRRRSEPDLLELHPLVRQFVKSTFSQHDRSTFINAILRVYKRIIGIQKAQLSRRPSMSVLQYWTQNAELDISAGNFKEAFSMLAESANAFHANGYSREFCRVARMLFSRAPWETHYQDYEDFEKVFRNHVKNLGYIGESAEVDELLSKYELTLPEKNARYIHYCELQCHSKWVRGDFSSAVTWGREGQTLKDSGVDTQYDISHTLALAQRDAGMPELALPVFLGGRPLAQVIEPKELDRMRGAPHYGNVGRCLHFMGQVEGALTCYQKSALLLETEVSSERSLNQGYIRAWIAELLLSKGQSLLAYSFARAAYLKWEQIYPARGAEQKKFSRQIKLNLDVAPDDTSVEPICVDWILGRSVDKKVATASKS